MAASNQVPADSINDDIYYLNNIHTMSESDNHNYIYRDSSKSSSRYTSGTHSSGRRSHPKVGEFYDTTDSETDISDIDEQYLDSYEYKTDSQTDIKIYNGVIYTSKQNLVDNINLFTKLSDNECILQPVESSTLTAKGLLKNLTFQHETIIAKMTMPTDTRIIKIGCNEEEIYIFPNDYVEYNIIHILDIVKNSKNKQYKTRIECRCQDLLDHADYLYAQYINLIDYITKIKSTDIVRRIEQYIILTLKARNRQPYDRIIKIYKKISVFIFHNYLYDDDIANHLNLLLTQLSRTREFEMHEAFPILRKLTQLIINIVAFIKGYINQCICIKQPYMFGKKLQIKPSAEILKKKKVKSCTHKYTRKRSAGCGKYFSSQITFEIYSHLKKKIYKIKIFRNGRFQAPGIKDPSMHDIIEPLYCLVQFIHQQFGTDIYASYIISVMRNYLTHIIHTPTISPFKDYNGKPKTFDCHLFINKIYDILRIEKLTPYIVPADALNIYYSLYPYIGDLTNRVFYYCNFTTIKIAGISNNIEKSGGIYLKFERSTPEKPNKKITMKIYPTGKINFDGCNSELEMQELYAWINYIFRRHKSSIIFDNATFSLILSDDDEGYASIYDKDP